MAINDERLVIPEFVLPSARELMTNCPMKKPTFIGRNSRPADNNEMECCGQCELTETLGIYQKKLESFEGQSATDQQQTMLQFDVLGKVREQWQSEFLK
jgi:hypothetical protein